MGEDLGRCGKLYPLGNILLSVIERLLKKTEIFSERIDEGLDLEFTFCSLKRREYLSVCLWERSICENRFFPVGMKLLQLEGKSKIEGIYNSFLLSDLFNSSIVPS